MNPLIILEQQWLVLERQWRRFQLKKNTVALFSEAQDSFAAVCTHPDLSQFELEQLQEIGRRLQIFAEVIPTLRLKDEERWNTIGAELETILQRLYDHG